MKFKVLAVLALLFLFAGPAMAQTLIVNGNWSFVRNGDPSEEVYLNASSASSFRGQYTWRAPNGVVRSVCDIDNGILRTDNSMTFTISCSRVGQDHTLISVAGRPASDDTITGTWRQDILSGTSSGTFVMKRW